MKKYKIISLGLLLLMAGCTTYQRNLEEQPQSAQKPASSEITTVTETVPPPAPSPEQLVAEKPTKKEIQTALKNAGFYNGEIDGKFGPQTKSAVEAFQSANGLKVDGTVGPQTWNLLKKYLNLNIEEQPAAEKGNNPA